MSLRLHYPVITLLTFNDHFYRLIYKKSTHNKHRVVSSCITIIIIIIIIIIIFISIIIVIIIIIIIS